MKKIMTLHKKSGVFRYSMGLILLLMSAVFSYGQGDCSCVADQVIVQLTNATNLPAVATQYGLNATPLA